MSRIAFIIKRHKQVGEMQINANESEMSLMFSLPWEVDSVKVVGKPKFLKIQEVVQGSGRYLEVVCNEPKYFPAFEAFSDLVVMNVKEKHLPALSVFLNALRTWNWEGYKKSA
jgi:hypothetical protein